MWRARAILERSLGLRLRLLARCPLRRLDFAFVDADENVVEVAAAVVVVVSLIGVVVVVAAVVVVVVVGDAVDVVAVAAVAVGDHCSSIVASCFLL